MKFKNTFDEYEVEYFTRNRKKKVKEAEDTWTKDDYEKYSNILISTPVNHKDIDGYMISVDGELQYCKYDVNSQLFVNYKYANGNIEIVKRYKRSNRDYQGSKYIDYVDEIPINK